MSGVTTSETPVVIGLTVLLLLWLIVPLNWGLRAVGCLLLLLWSDHPTSLLLLGSPVLSVRYDPCNTLNLGGYKISFLISTKFSCYSLSSSLFFLFFLKVENYFIYM
jgi:hypothetical protein